MPVQKALYLDSLKRKQTAVTCVERRLIELEFQLNFTTFPVAVKSLRRNIYECLQLSNYTTTLFGCNTSL